MYYLKKCRGYANANTWPFNVKNSIDQNSVVINRDFRFSLAILASKITREPHRFPLITNLGFKVATLFLRTVSKETDESYQIFRHGIILSAQHKTVK